MDMETAWPIAFWAVVSASLFAAYINQRKEGKDLSWAEIVLCFLCFPGLVFLTVFALLLVVGRRLWELLDKPIKRRRE